MFFRAYINEKQKLLYVGMLHDFKKQKSGDCNGVDYGKWVRLNGDEYPDFETALRYVITKALTPERIKQRYAAVGSLQHE